RVAEMHHQQIALVAKQRKHGGLAGNVVFHFQQRVRGFCDNLMLLSRAQLAPFRPAYAKHLVQDARAFNRQRYRMQVFFLNLHLSLSRGCHLFPCLLPCGYCDCKPAALDFVSMPVAKTSAAKTAAAAQTAGAKTRSPAKPPASSATVKSRTAKTKA